MNTAVLIRFYASLTERQQDVVEIVSEGLSNREAGLRLRVQPSVIAGHLTNIYQLLDNIEGLPESHRSSRYTLIHLFTPFFAQHPHLKRFEHHQEN